METKTPTYDVIVHKAGLPMAKDESIGEYSNALRQAGSKYILNQIKSNNKTTNIYMVEAYSDSAIFDVYQYSVNGPGEYKYYAVKYTRKDNGDFSFSGMVEVERVTSFEPKTQLSISKAVWDTAYVNDLPDSSFAYISPGGKKDASGKTEPRSLRHLPYKDASGKVDKAHLRNALARLDQTNIPAAAKSEAKKKLQAAAKGSLPTYSKTEKAGLANADGWVVSEKSLWSGVL